MLFRSEKDSYVVGQVFYAYNEDTFYELAETATLTKELVETTFYIARVGRPSLYYQYRHNAPLTSRIDPGTTNIIDLYLVTAEYYTAYQNYIKLLH